MGVEMPRASICSSMARLFDTYVMVDWSASSVPKLGADSIWYSIARTGSNCNCSPLLQNNAAGVLSTPSTASREAERKERTNQGDIYEDKFGVESTSGRVQTARSVGKRRKTMEPIIAPKVAARSLDAEITGHSPAGSHRVTRRQTMTPVTNAPGISRRLEDPTQRQCTTAGDCSLCTLLVENVPTRAIAEAVLIEKLVVLVRGGKRVLLGFDFSLGFSRGFAAALAVAARRCSSDVRNPEEVSQTERRTEDASFGGSDRIRGGEDRKEDAKQTVVSSDGGPIQGGNNPRQRQGGAENLVTKRRQGTVKKSKGCDQSNCVEGMTEKSTGVLVSGSSMVGSGESESVGLRVDTGENGHLEGAKREEGLAGGVGGLDQSSNWKIVWEYLHKHVVDGDDNSNNRFEVAAQINEMSETLETLGPNGGLDPELVRDQLQARLIHLGLKPSAFRIPKKPVPSHTSA